MKTILILGMGTSLLLTGCSKEKEEEDLGTDSNNKINPTEFNKTIGSQALEHLPEGEMDKVYFVYEMNESLSEDEKVIFCMSFGELTIDQWAKDKAEGKTPEQNEVCLGIDDPSLTVNGGTNITAPTVRVKGSKESGFEYELNI